MHTAYSIAFTIFWPAERHSSPPKTCANRAQLYPLSSPYFPSLPFGWASTTMGLGPPATLCFAPVEYDVPSIVGCRTIYGIFNNAGLTVQPSKSLQTPVFCSEELSAGFPATIGRELGWGVFNVPFQFRYWVRWRRSGFGARVESSRRLVLPHDTTALAQHQDDGIA